MSKIDQLIFYLNHIQYVFAQIFYGVVKKIISELDFSLKKHEKSFLKIH